MQGSEEFVSRSDYADNRNYKNDSATYYYRNNDDAFGGDNNKNDEYLNADFDDYNDNIGDDDNNADFDFVSDNNGWHSEMTTGAAKVDSPLPPSFPPSSFPQVPKLALAAPVILARRAGIQHNRVAIIQKRRRQYAQ